MNRVYLETRDLNPRSSIFDQRKSHCTILPLDSRNQESAQIPGFWNPMVKWCNGIFSDQKSSSAGSSPVSPNRHGSTREQIIPPEPPRTCKLMRMTGSKKYSPVGTKAQPRVGLDFFLQLGFFVYYESIKRKLKIRCKGVSV